MSTCPVKMTSFNAKRCVTGYRVYVMGAQPELTIIKVNYVMKAAWVRMCFKALGGERLVATSLHPVKRTFMYVAVTRVSDAYPRGALPN